MAGLAIPCGGNGIKFSLLGLGNRQTEPQVLERAVSIYLFLFNFFPVERKDFQRKTPPKVELSGPFKGLFRHTINERCLS